MIVASSLDIKFKKDNGDVLVSSLSEIRSRKLKDEEVDVLLEKVGWKELKHYI